MPCSDSRREDEDEDDEKEIQKRANEATKTACTLLRRLAIHEHRSTLADQIGQALFKAYIPDQTCAAIVKQVMDALAVEVLVHDPQIGPGHYRFPAITKHEKVKCSS